MNPPCRIARRRAPTGGDRSLPSVCRQSLRSGAWDALSAVFPHPRKCPASRARHQLRQMARPSAPCRRAQDSCQETARVFCRIHSGKDTPHAPAMHTQAGCTRRQPDHQIEGRPDHSAAAGSMRSACSCRIRPGFSMRSPTASEPEASRAASRKTSAARNCADRHSRSRRRALP